MFFEQNNSVGMRGMVCDVHEPHAHKEGDGEAGVAGGGDGSA